MNQSKLPLNDGDKPDPDDDEGMKELRSAFDLMRPGETGLFICTDGRNDEQNFEINEHDRTGCSGWWVLDPDRNFDRVFIFLRGEGSSSPNEVFSSVFVGFDPPLGRRYKLRLKDVRREGTTRSSWRLFASASQNPIRFLSADVERGGIPIAIAEVLEILEPLQERYGIRDIRRPPDNLRRGRFRQGWEDAADRLDVYKERTLKQLTWQNLGNRLGNKFGPRTPEQIDTVYENIALLFQENQTEKLVDVPGGDLEPEGLWEGARRQATVNTYMRSLRARRQCLEHYGYRCVVCDVSLEEEYGPDAVGVIHVHHLHLISMTEGEYEVDPKTDMVPVCPNCHAIIHRKDPPSKIDEVRAMRRLRNRSCSDVAIPRPTPTDDLSE